MAEVPHPVRLWRDVRFAVRYKVVDVLEWFNRRTREQYTRPGERDR